VKYPLKLIVLASLFSLSCRKSEVVPCNNKTLLLHFSCEGDLANADGLDLHVVRDDGVAVDLASTLKCPGTHSYEISIASYQEGRRFNLTATPTKNAVPLANASILSDVQLEPNCTSIDFKVSSMGGAPKDASAMDGDVATGTDTGPPACTPGSLGCSCNRDACSNGLMCTEGTCTSASCGNGVVDPGEECDKGSLNDNATYGGCKSNCSYGPRCGDGIKNGTEDCDDNNKLDTDLCSNACLSCSGRAGYLACGTSCLKGVACCPGSTCAPASCSGALFTPATACNQSGQCGTVNSSTCPGNFLCSGTLCGTTCTADAQCASGFTCSAGTCIPKPCGRFGESCCASSACSEGSCLSGKCVTFGGAYQTNGATCVQGNPLNSNQCACLPGFVASMILSEPFLNRDDVPRPIFYCSSTKDSAAADYRGHWRDVSGLPNCATKCSENPLNPGQCNCPMGAASTIFTANGCLEGVGLCEGTGALSYGGTYREISYSSAGDMACGQSMFPEGCDKNPKSGRCVCPFGFTEVRFETSSRWVGDLRSGLCSTYLGVCMRIP
jgi:cysteine-rich repeat protein